MSRYFEFELSYRFFLCNIQPCELTWATRNVTIFLTNLSFTFFVSSLRNVSNPSEDRKATNGVQHPLHHISGLEGGNVRSLVATPDFLIAGGVGEIKGFEWKNVIAGKNEQSFKVQVPVHR